MKKFAFWMAALVALHGFAETIVDVTGEGVEKISVSVNCGGGVYEKTLTTASGCGCSCSKEEKVVKFKSDAPKLFESGQFQDLMND